MKFQLTDQQKEWIKQNGEKVKWSVIEITKAITGDETKDGRSNEGKAVKKYLANELHQKPQVTTINSKTYKRFELDDDQKLFVKNNILEMSSTVEIAEAIFPNILTDYNPKQKLMCKEVRAVQAYVSEELDQSLLKATNDNRKIGKFSPPRAVKDAIGLINKFTASDMEADKLKDHQRESILKLCKNLRRISLVNMVNEFRDNNEKELFLESFISDTWDKSDLTQGEISQYIDLAGERVHLAQIKRHQQELQDLLQDDMDSEDGKLKYTLIEAIDKQIQNRDKCMGRIAKLQTSLEGTRTQRLKDKAPDNISIVSIIEKFQNEKQRKEFLEMQKLQDQVLEQEIDKLADMDEYIARIMGASKSELISQQSQ